MRTKNMHTFFIDDLIQLYCLRHVSNDQVFILRKTCTCSLYGITFMHPYGAVWYRPSCFYGCMKEMSYKLHLQYKSSCGWTLGCSEHVEDDVIELNHQWKKVCTLLVLITYVYHNARLQNVKFYYLFIYANWYSFIKNIFSISNISTLCKIEK